MNPDGSVDRGFQPRLEVSDIVCLVSQDDGKLVLSGWFDLGTVGDHRLIREGSIRLNDDGRVDDQFGTGDYQPLLAWVGGCIFFLAGDLLGRLNADGTPEPSFALALNSYSWGYRGHALCRQLA